MAFTPPTTLEEALVIIAQLLEENRRLALRVEELERRLGMNSQNSSRPPSSDPPEARRRSKQRSGRKPGGQPGHKGHRRELVPPERVDDFVDLWPDTCEQCHRDLPRRIRDEVGEPERHQVTEIPEARACVTEFRMHTQCCPDCDWATTASLPDGVPRGAFGPRLQAVMSLFTGVYRFGKRLASEAFGDLFGVPISTGSVVACEQRTSAILAAPVAEATDHIQRQAVIHADETSWREARRRAWLWVACTPLVAVFLIHARRGLVAMKKLLGDFGGVLVSDRWVAYEDHKGRRQLCWAHLRRHFEGFAEYTGDIADVGRELLRQTKALFRLWHRVRDGTLDRTRFRAKVRPLRAKIEMLLLAGAQCAQPKPKATCKELWRLHEHLWTFVEVEGVEPTNNAAERALRPGVIRRKLSFGTHSADGSRFVERMLTVATTLRLQKRNVVEYLVEASERALHGRRPPSLLPTDRPRTVAACYLQAAAAA